jgi:hypothetical protein
VKILKRFSWLVLVSLLAGSAFAQNADIIKDSRRRQAFQRQVDAWAEIHAKPAFLTVLDRLDRVGVNVIEATTVLPPDLGGPRPGSIIRVKIEMQADGYGADSFGAGYDRFGNFGRSSRLHCRIHQSVMARVDPSGRPAQLIAGQTITTPTACVSRY